MLAYSPFFFLPGFSFGQSTIQPKLPLQDYVFPFRHKGCTFNGSMLSHSPINYKDNTLKMVSTNPALNINKITKNHSHLMSMLQTAVSNNKTFLTQFITCQ